MEAGLGRNDSMFAKNSIISKRKKIAIISAVVIVVLVVIIGLAVGVSQKNKHSSKSKQDAAAVTPTEKPITTKPGELSDIPVPSKSLSIQRQTMLADKIDPPLLDTFLSALEEVANSAAQAGAPLIAMDLDPKRKISSRSLLMYIRDMNVDTVMSALVGYANSTSLSSLDLLDLAQLVTEVKKLVNPKSIRAWGKLLAKGHLEMGDLDIPMSAVALKALAEKQKVTLPITSVTRKAIQQALNFTTDGNHTEHVIPETIEAPAGRKMLQTDTFDDLCIPVVFHVLQFNYVSEALTTEVFPGTGYTNGSQHLVDHLNTAFSNAEWETLFKQIPTDTKIRFRLEAVEEDPAVSPHLGVTQDQWAACAQDKDMMATIATAAAAKYPPTKFINVIICGDPGDGTGVLGYAYVPGKKFVEATEWGHIFLRYDEFHPLMNNRVEAFNRGGWTLAHEVGHHLGLHHPHAKTEGTCVDGDELDDTTATEVVQLQDYYGDLNEMCDA